MSQCRHASIHDMCKSANEYIAVDQASYFETFLDLTTLR
jgi:hypothetical protein